MPLDPRVLQMLMGSQGNDPGQSFSGQGGNMISNVAPPAPLSGLNFAEQAFSGATGAGSLGGRPSGGGFQPGMQGGPGLDMFQLLAQLGGDGQVGGGAELGAANTNPLTAGIGSFGAGGILNTSLGQQGLQQGLQPGFTAGQAGPSGITAGQTGGSSSDPLALIQKILGLASKGKQVAQLGQEFLGSAGGIGAGGTPSGAADAGNLTALTTGQEVPTSQSLAESGLLSFLNTNLQDPTFQLNTLGLLQGGESPQSFLGSLSADQLASLQSALFQGAEGPSGIGAGTSLGANLNLTDPSIAPAASGVGSTLGGIGGWGGLAASLLGAIAGQAGSKPLGAAAQGIGTGAQLASLGSNLAALEGGAELGLGAGAGLAFAPVALGTAAAGISDLFNTSAENFARGTRDLFGSVPGVLQQWNTAPQITAQSRSNKTAQDWMNTYNQFQSLQDRFQQSGVENLLGSGGTVTGENTANNLFGGGGNFSATFPNASALYQSMVPSGALIDIGRMRAADQIGQLTGQRYGLDPMSYAYGTPGFMQAMYPAGQTAYSPSESVSPPNTPGLMENPNNPGQYVNANLYQAMEGLQPGRTEQGLADILALYGGWGNIGGNTGLNMGQGMPISQFMLPAEAQNPFTLRQFAMPQRPVAPSPMGVGVEDTSGGGAP